MDEQKTIFAIRVQNHHSEKLKLDEISGGLGGFLAGVLATAVGGGAILLVGSYWYFILAVFAGAILIVVGLGMTIFTLLKPTKSVVCPNCNHKQRIFSNSSNYVCPKCSELLILGRDHTKNPSFSTCPYCGLKIAVSDDVGPFPCPDCGIQRKSGMNQVASKEECNSCGSGVPEEAIYCVSCGNILRTNLQAWASEGNEGLITDLEGRAGKSPRGHYMFARAILQTLDHSLDQENFRDYDYSPFTLLEESLVSLEVAANDKTLKKELGTLFPQIDRTLGKILNWELSVLDAAVAGKKDDVLFDKIPIDENYMLPRQKLEELFEDDLQSLGSIGNWGKNLVIWEKGKSSSWITSYDNLKKETQRFKDWITKNPI